MDTAHERSRRCRADLQPEAAQERQITHEPGTPMWSPDPLREAVPIAGSAGKTAMYGKVSRACRWSVLHPTTIGPAPSGTYGRDYPTYGFVYPGPGTLPG
jgi:hypothetical protein